MANTTITPNMNLVVPVVATDPGPDWANNVNASLSIIDGHNHTNGSGVPIGSDGLAISSDLPLNGNGLTQVGAVQFISQGSTLPGSTLDALYVVNKDLYYNDGNGTPVRITLGGSVTGAAGTITGLPSGTASASFNLGTFAFKQSTNVPAAMDVGPLSIGAAVANPKKVNLKASALMAADYDLTLPLSLPSSAQILQLSNSGQASYLPFIFGAAPSSNSFASSDSSGNISFPFKWLQVDGVAGPSTGPTILPSGSFLNFIGGFGTTTLNGVSGGKVPMNWAFTGTWHGCYISIGAYGISIANNDTVNSNAFSVILFYI